MEIHAIVFDFDGTLIDSNQLKYNAYFSLFPPDERHITTIRAVLSEIFEQSRYVILEEICRRLGGREGGLPENRVRTLAGRYNRIVLEGAKLCPEKPGAEKALERLASEYDLYVSSTTPENALKEILQFREWEGYFRGIFGFPHEKSDTLRRIMALENLKNHQVLVVGDGESDRISAMENGCRFLQVTETFCFEELDRILEKHD